MRPERVLDFEAGWNFRAANLELAANVYAMEFRNEIASTGELSDIGLLLRRNVDRSYRRGIELDAAWQVAPALRSKTNANFSRNRIDEWTQFFDVYDVEGNYVGSRPVHYEDVEPLLTPSVHRHSERRLHAERAVQRRRHRRATSAARISTTPTTRPSTRRRSSSSTRNASYAVTLVGARDAAGQQPARHRPRLSERLQLPLLHADEVN